MEEHPQLAFMCVGARHTYTNLHKYSNTHAHHSHIHMLCYLLLPRKARDIARAGL